MNTIRNLFSKFDKLLFLWIVSFILNIITFLLIHYKIGASNRTVALHYNVLVGVDLYGKGTALYNIPLVGFILTVVNIILFNALKNKQFFLAFLSAFMSVVVQIILLLAVLFLIKVN